MKRKRDGMSGLAESLGLPLDACRGETVLTFMGRSMVRIENYRSILVYSDTYIKILAGKYRLSINGKRLRIRYYDKDEMEITGKIDAIGFDEG